jgi:hypothetical protein
VLGPKPGSLRRRCEPRLRPESACPCFLPVPRALTATAIVVGIPPPGISRTISKECIKDVERFVRGGLHTSGHFSPLEPPWGVVSQGVCKSRSC